MVAVGIDGCSNGWCAAIISEQNFRIALFQDINEVFDQLRFANVFLIDIPVGLGNQYINRDVDRVARKELTPYRQSSIFTPPVREAITATDYNEAKSISKQITGKMISVQSWNITRKIRETDEFLLENPDWRLKVHEAHPEICFKYLNYGIIPAFRKHDKGHRGIHERLSILSNYESHAENVYAEARKKFASSEVKGNDIVDAMCLVITASLGLNYGFEIIKGGNNTDEHGIEMGIYYYNPANH